MCTYIHKCGNNVCNMSLLCNTELIYNHRIYNIVKLPFLSWVLVICFGTRNLRTWQDCIKRDVRTKIYTHMNTFGTRVFFCVYKKTNWHCNMNETCMEDGNLTTSQYSSPENTLISICKIFRNIMISH